MLRLGGGGSAYWVQPCWPLGLLNLHPTPFHTPHPQPASKKQKLDLNTSKATANGAADEEPPSTTVFVGNLPWSVGEEDIRGLFEECGEIKSVRIGEWRWS